MLTRSTRVRLAAFVVVAVLGMTYLSVRYLGVARWVSASGYTVSARFADTGGIFTNAEVDYRGVPVGRVGGIRLTKSGVAVDLDIDTDRRIPADARAVVANRSVIGEQFVDLRPRSSGGPYLHDGSTIARSDTDTPPPVAQLLISTDDFVNSVPITALQGTVDELYAATRGVRDNLRRLISAGRSLSATAYKHLPETINLINSGSTVLANQNAQSQTITRLAANLKAIGKQLRSSDGDISTVLRDAAPAARTVNTLFTGISAPLLGLLKSLFVTSRVFLANKDGLRTVLADVPVTISVTGSVTTPQGINVGLVPTLFAPLPCTKGYGGTKVRSGLTTSGNPALNTDAGCTAPVRSGQAVRGPRSGTP